VVGVNDKAKKGQGERENQCLSRLSPFRYPGGKTWLRKRILKWVTAERPKPRLFVEPFAGGASVALAIAESDAAESVLIIERDPQVAAVWRTILGDEWHQLARMVRNFSVTRRSVDDVLKTKPSDDVSIAFRCLLKNRVSRGGILARGAGILRRGEDGNGLCSRWYPEALSARIKAVHELHGRLRFKEGNGVTYIHRYLDSKSTVIFADPPYSVRPTHPGQRLYDFKEFDHDKLFETLAAFAGRCAITYSESRPIRRLAEKYGFQVERLRMRTTHHRERFELFMYK
jgi:DNA adenine methylase